MRPTALVIALLLATVGFAGQAQAASYPTPKYGVSPQVVTVTNVVDGDTFDVSTGKRVRVLGINSCEMSTQGGVEAKNWAEIALKGKTVTLTQEPGVDLDKYGRQLRYVAISVYPGDFGLMMARYPHTGIYAGHNDASAAYINALREDGGNDRNCAGVLAQSQTSDTHVYVRGGDDDHHSRVGHKVWRKMCHHWWC